MSQTLLERLAACVPAALPMHMPGHKRNTALAGYLERLGAELDITEIDGFDNLHDAHGVLAQGMARAAALWGSARAFYLVNGSTCGNLAAVRAVLGGQGGRVLAARNCHRSVWNALELCRAETEFLYPCCCPETGAFGALLPEAVEAALTRRPDTRLVVLTSPTYEGVVSDVAGVCRAAHRRGVPVLVDEAHGAHLGFGYGFPDGAVHAGADLVVQSLHKTLPSLTQTALLHVSGGLVDAQRVQAALAMFETSSPSYLLMASIDGCVELLERRGPGLFAAWEQALGAFSAQTAGLHRLRLFRGGALPPGAAHDPSKLVVCTAGTSLTGPQLAERLRREHAVECEAAMAGAVIAMTGMGDTEQTLSRFAAALLEIDAGLSEGPRTVLPQLPEQTAVLPAWRAAERPRRLLPVQQAAGCVCAETVWAYPPGIPLLLPGERIGADFAGYLVESAACGVTVYSSLGQLPQNIGVLIDKTP